MPRYLLVRDVLVDLGSILYARVVPVTGTHRSALTLRFRDGEPIHLPSAAKDGEEPEDLRQLLVEMGTRSKEMRARGSAASVSRSPSIDVGV